MEDSTSNTRPLPEETIALPAQPVRLNRHLVDEAAFLDTAKAAMIPIARLKYKLRPELWYRDVETLGRASFLEEVTVISPPDGFDLDELFRSVPDLKYLSLVKIDRILSPPDIPTFHLTSLTLDEVRMPQSVAKDLLQTVHLPFLSVLTPGFIETVAGEQYLPQVSSAFVDQLDCHILLTNTCYHDLVRSTPPLHTSTPILMPYTALGDFPVFPFPSGSTAPNHIHCYSCADPARPLYLSPLLSTLRAVASSFPNPRLRLPAAMWLPPLLHPSHPLHSDRVTTGSELERSHRALLDTCAEWNVKVEYYTREEEAQSLTSARPPAAFWRYAKELRRARAGL
ncbi:hypothetical protein JCM10207_006321 [Rhodosporidiobolus poonsookiae]